MSQSRDPSTGRFTSNKAEYEISLKDMFSGPLSGLERKMDSFESKLGNIGQTIAGVFGGSLLAGGFQSIVSGIRDAGIAIVKLGADMEQTRISFTTMLGSAEKANSTIKELIKFAEITPFGQNEVITGAKQLLAYGFAAENLTTDLRKLGDVSAGLSIPLGDLVYLYGTIRTQGKAMTKDLMQFANRGIPIYTALTKVTGKSGEALQKMVEDGKIGFATIEKAFNTLTGAGSMFGGLMEKQSRSLAGRFSTLKDKILVMGTAIGESLIPNLGKILEWTISMVDFIPRLDFSPLLITFQQIGNQLVILSEQFSQLFSILFQGTSTFDVLTIAIRYLSGALRVPFTVIQFGITMYTQLITLIKDSLPVFQGLGNVIAGLFNRDFTQFLDGIDQIGEGISKLGKDSTAIWSNFMHDQKTGWAKIFAPITDPAKNSSFSAGLGTGNAGGGKGGVSAVDAGAGSGKIASSTRNVTLNISTIKLADNIVSQKADMSDVKVQEMLRKALLAAVNDVNIVAQ